MRRSDRAPLVQVAAQRAVAPLSLAVEEVTVTPMGRRQVVRVSVDRDLADLDPDDERSRVPPVSLDEVADASTAVAACLDAEGVMGEESYVLEVTSPGAERRLTLPRHYRRNVGRLLVVTTRNGQRLTGRLVAVGAGRLVLQLEGDGESTLPLDVVDRAHVQVEFGGGVQEDLEEI